MVECSVPFFPQRHATRALPVSTSPRESAAPPVALSTLRRRWADVATRAGTGLSWDGRRRSRSKKSMADGDGKYDEQRSHRLAFVGVFQLLKERHEGPVLREMFECLAIALHARRPQAAPQWRRTEECQAFRRSSPPFDPPGSYSGSCLARDGRDRVGGSLVPASMRGLRSGVVSAMLRNVFARALYYAALARAKDRCGLFCACDNK